MGKSFKGGIDSMLQSTTRESKTISTANKETKNASDEMISLQAKISKELKKKMDIYCAENGIKKQEFVGLAIEKYIK